uniref:Uncharacterized protein n=1 Tax=Mesocestoides corti TaxID=53468 RepID=A0A5K3FQQ1_MESCO
MRHTLVTIWSGIRGKTGSLHILVLVVLFSRCPFHGAAMKEENS